MDARAQARVQQTQESNMKRYGRKTKAWVTSMKWEMFMLVVVLFYFVVVFVTFALSDQKVWRP